MWVAGSDAIVSTVEKMLVNVLTKKEEFFNATTGEWRKQRARRLDVPVLQDSDAEDDNIITGM